MRIDRLDHIVLTVEDIESTIAFYTGVLGMRHETVDSRHALYFGCQKINLHARGREFEPKAAHPMPGSGDLCFVATGTIDEIAAYLEDHGATIEEGPVPRTGALGAMHTLYLRDPDRNLVEIAAYDAADAAREGL